MATFYYLAYGSNLHPIRMRERCQSAILLDCVTLVGYKISFHKEGKDGSGKCNIFKSDGDIVYGAIFEINESERKILDKAEGNGYLSQQIPVQCRGKELLAVVYMAKSIYIHQSLQPNDEYKAFVVEGARYHGMPTEYIAMLDNTPSRPDPNRLQALKNQELLNNMRLFVRP